MKTYLHHRGWLLLLWLGMGLLHPQPSQGQSRALQNIAAHLTPDQVVTQMVRHNAERANALGSYRSRRLYTLDYVGFPTHLHAAMLLDMTYTAPDKKEFTIISKSGNEWLVDHILKRLADSEREASEGDNWKRNALTTLNYDFASAADDGVSRSCSYALAVEPKVATKFLYRGRVWVDPTDFAVCRIEVEPAKNPSVWIKRTDIHHSYSKIGDFWLPKENKSVSTIRIGGRATLTIEYQNYQILAARPVEATEAGPAVQSAGGLR